MGKKIVMSLYGKDVTGEEENSENIQVQEIQQNISNVVNDGNVENQKVTEVLHPSVTVAQNFQQVSNVSSAMPLQPHYYGHFTMIPQNMAHNFQLLDIASAGVNFQQAQSFNHDFYSKVLELDHKAKEYWIEETHQINTKEIDRRYASTANANVTIGMEEQTFGNKTFDCNQIPRKFVYKLMLVKEFYSGKLFLWMRNFDLNRHIFTNESELKEYFREYLEADFGIVEYTEAEFNRMFNKVMRLIPILNKSDLRKLVETELMFENGIYDIMTKKFTPTTETDRIFNKFSMLYPFEENASNPDAFDAVLNDMFDGNESLNNLAYEIIGAIISPVSTLKRIYAFQGVSDGGKTRLANIMFRLIDESDVYSFNTVSDITNDELAKQSHNCRLVYIKDCSRHKLKDKQISYLKSFADGGRLSNSAVFKILICTNYKIVTGDNDFLEPALKNRFQILQFPKPMDNIDEKVLYFEEHFFEKERAGIVKKALEAFHNVVVNGGRFSYDCPINECVEATEEAEELSAEERMRLNQVLETPMTVTESKLEQVFNNIFQFTEERHFSAKRVFEILNEILPEEVKDPASMGRKLLQIFKDKLQSKRTSEGTLYNLQLKPRKNIEA